MGTIVSQITSLTTVYSTVYSDVDQRKHQSSASLTIVRGIHRERGKRFHLMTSSVTSNNLSTILGHVTTPFSHCTVIYQSYISNYTDMGLINKVSFSSPLCLMCVIQRLLPYWCAILIAHQIVMAKHGGSCVHFSGISTCGRTSRETVSHPQCPPLPTLCKISLPIYVIVTNKLLEPLTTTWYDSLVLSFSFLKI